MTKRFFVKFFAIVSLLIFSISVQNQLFGAEYKYASEGRRDPFIPLVTGEIIISLGLESVTTIEDIKFEGVIFDPSGESMAILNGEVVKEGDKPYNVEVVKIYENAITIKIHDEPYTIDLSEEGGETIER